MEILNKNDFETIDNTRLQEIKLNAVKENALYYDLIVKEFELYINTTKKPFATQAFKTPSRGPAKGKKYNSLPNFKSLVQRVTVLTYEANKYKFDNIFEQKFFEINALFPDDEKFLEILKSSYNLNLIDNFIINYTYFDQYDEKQNRLKKQTYLNQYLRKNKEEILTLLLYFKKFHNIKDLEIIINRTLQIYYTNNELYNEYTNKAENNKKLTK